MNEILLRKKLKILVPAKGKNDSKQLVLTIMKNLEGLGYIFSKKLTNHLVTLNKTQLENLYLEIVPVLKKMRGAHKKFEPMYPNFPQQVIDMSEMELYFNAIVHYWTLWMPVYEKEERLPLSEEYKLEIIDTGTQKDLDNIFTTLLAAKSSISEDDKAIIKSFINEKKEGIVDLLPEEIPMKENLTFLIGNLLGVADASKVMHLVKTTTDVLRVLTALSGGDVSLAENTKFKNLGRPARKFFLTLLENVLSEEEMVKYKNRWIRVGEILHPGEYKKWYPKCFRAFSKLRDSKKIETYNSKVESSIKNDVKEAVTLLSKRPGLFARRLDELLRQESYPQLVVSSFLEVAPNVANPVLLQVLSHFENRANGPEQRVFFPKGNLSKMQVIPNTLSPLSKEVCNKLCKGIRKVLVEKFSGLESLGNVYVDENLKNYLVPFSQRSASKALKTLVRGSKIPLESEKDTVRFFIWWKNIDNSWNGRVDLDLSAVILDDNWNFREQIAYYNLKGYGGHHSGDITNAPNGAAEFIDISKSKVTERGGRYIAMCVNSYTCQPFHDLPECFAGWMLRESPNSGEIFEAKTVQNKVDISGESRMNIPLIIDVVENKVIWCDMCVTSVTWNNNVARNKQSIQTICRAIAELKKPDLYNLFSLHAKARGKLVNDRKKADIIFSEYEGVTPLETDKIMAEFL